MSASQDYFEIHKEYDSLFSAAGINELSDIDWIMVEVTGKKRSELAFSGKFLGEESAKIHAALNERLKHKPLGYIFGHTEFYGRTFKVTSSVLIPRMDTEILIDEAKAAILKMSKETGEPVSILDIGTGSGAIAITLQKETNQKVTAIDISSTALEIAKENAKNLSSNVCFIHSNLFENLKGKKFDIIVSNPPYIETEVLKTLDAEVKDHEPLLALDGGADGLDFYRKIIEKAPLFLNKNGQILLEIGYNQAKNVQNLLEKDFENAKIIKDYGGNDRVVAAKIRRKV